MSSQNKISSSRVALTSFLVDISDIALNFTVAMLSGSAVMTTQWLQGVADLTASTFTLIGVHQANRPPNKSHPFGYGRELFFWTMLSGLFMFTVTAGLSFYFGVQRLTHPTQLKFLPVSFAVLFIGFLTNGYSFSLSYRRLIGSYPKSGLKDAILNSSLVGAKTTLVSDFLGAAASVLGLLALLLYGLTGNSAYDGLGAIIVSLLLFFLAFFLLLNIRGLIIGQSASPKTQQAIINVVKKTPEVVKVIGIKTSIIGPEKIIVNLEVNLKDHLTVKQIEKILDQIKLLAKKEVPTIHDIFIELETPDEKLTPKHPPELPA